MHVIVTGGAGFVGTKVIDRLIQRGDDVTVVDVVDPARPDARYVEASVVDADAMQRHVRDADSVIHLAGYVRAGICLTCGRWGMSQC